jgi:hypothetical protein
VIFVHPLLLGGLILVGIPVLLHLIMRQKPKHMVFPALRFLMVRHRATQRKLQLRHLLLLALRMALIAAMCLALARPKIFTDRFNINTDRPIALALLFDTSYSMEYSIAGRTRLDDAKARSQELLDDLPAGSRVAVLDSSEPGGEWLPSVSLARDRIAALELHAANYPVTTELTAAYDLLAKLADETASLDEAPLRYLYVFSDKTQSSWNSVHLETLQRMRDRVPPPGVRAVYVNVGAESPADIAIVSVELPKQVAAANERVTLRATVQASGTPCDTELSCVIDDQEPVERKVVKLEPGQREVFSFERRGLAPGFHQAKFSVGTPDAVPFDNLRFATFEVQGPRRVLTLTDDIRNVAIWKLAIESAGSFECEVKPISDPWLRGIGRQELAQFQCVCLVNVKEPPLDLWDKLLNYVKAGGGVGIFPGERELDASSYNSPAAQKVLPGNLVMIVKASETAGVSWREETYQHPILSPFRQWHMSDTVDFMKPGLEPHAFQYWRMDVPASETIVRYADAKNTPALAETIFDRKSIKGRVLLYSTAVDDRGLGRDGTTLRWNDYLQSSFYPVLVNLLIGYLAGDSEQRNFNYQSGQAVQVPRPAINSAYALQGPGLTAPQPMLARSDSQDQFEITQALVPGNFKVVGGDGKPCYCFSVNVPSEECEFAALPAEAIEALFGAGSVLPMQSKTSLRDALQSHWSQPVELLPWLMILLLIVLAAENFLANKFYVNEKPDEQTGQSTAER